MKPTIIILAVVAAFLAGGSPRGIPAAGTSGQIQFNRDGVLAGSPFLSWDDDNLVFSAGDHAGKGNHTALLIDDSNQSATVQATGPVIIGDEGWANGTRLIIDDRYSEIVASAPVFAHAGFVIQDYSGGWWRINVSPLGQLSVSPHAGPEN